MRIFYIFFFFTETSSIHEPPRRVSVLLPESVLAFNDYLFPGEGADEVIFSFKEMLDVDIDENNVENEIEILGGKNFYNILIEFFMSGFFFSFQFRLLSINRTGLALVLQ